VTDVSTLSGSSAVQTDRLLLLAACPPVLPLLWLSMLLCHCNVN